jgi:hypothetical protein
MEMGLLFLGLFISLYCLPAIIASSRGHRQKTSITLVNLLLGWSVFGWIAALIWACTADVDPKLQRGYRPPVKDARWANLRS